MTRIKPTVSLFSIWQRELDRVPIRFCYTIYTITIVAMHLVSHSPHACQLTSLSHAVTVTMCNMTMTWPFCDLSHMIFPTLHLSNNLKEKKRKRKKYRYWLSCFAKSWHCISSVQELNKDSIKFFLSFWTWSVSWLGKMAKSLFIFLFFFLTTQEGVQESVMSYDKSHDRCGKVVHRPCSSISSVQKITVRT